MARNKFFAFKRFNIYQDQCAMKVCTDACIFGAFFPKMINKKILDIGTGTGLLTLMAAQNAVNCHITSLEIDPKAATQAHENIVTASPQFNSVFNVLNIDFLDWSIDIDEKFDVIFTNPPFFEDSLKSDNIQKNNAKHGFEIEKWAFSIQKLLNPSGEIYFLLPPFEAQKLADEFIKYNFSAFKIINVRNKLQSPIIRKIVFLKKQPTDYEEIDFTIYQSEKVYTSQFIELLKPFYLYL